MDKAIVTVMLIIAGIVTSLAIFNGMYPVIMRSSGAIANAADKLNDRIESRIEIIEVSDNATTVAFWAKNVGTSTIPSIQRSDVFYGLQSNFSRVPYGSSGPPYPYWDYQLEGGNSKWSQTVTLSVTIYLDSAPAAGTYMLKMVIPNGISDETTFSVE